VAEALRARGAEVTFAGSPDRVEARLVPDAGFELDTFRVSGIPRAASLAAARALTLAGRAPIACLAIIRKRRPDVVLSGGGYVGGPMVLAAALQRVPAAVLEADAELGLANRLAAPFARRVFLSFPISGREPPKYRLTGRPIPERSRPLARDEGRRRFRLPADGPVVLVFGGSQGSKTLNELAIGAWAEAGPSVLHLCGEEHYEGLRPRVSRPDYRLVAFTDEIGAAFGAADVAVARAGGSVWELAAAGLAAVLVPYPHATAAHQLANARYFSEGVEIVRDEEAVQVVPGLVEELLADRDRMGRMGDAMRRLARPNAADDVAAEVLELGRA
jgi:UDP-N-acetylglucosamine--N-acetylmuramyl-(pentapeptide) pyrophosphoryl-undecaprenol N-acetylglucosamine transferase